MVGAAPLRCPNCGREFVGDRATARCPRCAWAPGRPLGPQARPIAPQPAQPGPPPGGGRRSRMATWAFVLSLAPIVLYALSAVIVIPLQASDGGGDDSGGSDGGEDDFEDEFGDMPPALAVLGSVASMVAVAAPIAGIALGVAARRDPSIDQTSRNLALAAIIMGAIVIGMYVLAMLFILLVILACAAACGSAGGGCAQAAAVAGGAAPCGALATRTRHSGLRGRLRDAFAHHPDLPALRADVYRVAGLRLCVGCFTAGPLFAAALAAAWLWPLPPAAAWGLGIPLAAAQALSAAGWTTSRWRKVAVKACLGVGAGLLLYAIATAPWPELAKSVAVAAGGLLALASTRPRLRRIARLAGEPVAPA